MFSPLLRLVTKWIDTYFSGCSAVITMFVVSAIILMDSLYAHPHMLHSSVAMVGAIFNAVIFAYTITIIFVALLQYFVEVCIAAAESENDLFG